MKEVSNVLSQYNEAMIYETAAIKEPQLVANILSTNSVNNYVDTINTAIDNANKTVIESITTKAGTINQNPNLDGFIFEEHHAGTFNIDAAVKQKSYHAEALKPELGETYGKNSIDIVIEDSGKVINEYQAKAYKNANKTAKAFNDKNGYKYVGQLKLVPTDQTRKIVNSLDKIKYNNVESKGITKTEIKEIQNDLQSRNIKRNIFDFKKDVNTISIIKQIGKQAMVNGTIGLGIGITTNIGINLINGKEVEAEQVIETGIKTGVSMGMATAIAGGIRVAVEKKVIPTVFSRILTNNTIGAIAAASMDILGTAFKLGSGEISLDRAMKDIGILISSVYSTIISSNIAYEGTKLIMGMVGMGTMGGVGTLIITVVSVVLRVVFRTVGSKFCNTITNGLERIREKTICESLEVVKDGAASIKNMAFGIIDKYKKIGEKLIPDALK